MIALELILERGWTTAIIFLWCRGWSLFPHLINR